MGLVISIAALTGCKYTLIEDGKIPAGFESYAHQAEGSYSGYVSKRSTGLQSDLRELRLDVTFVNQKIVLTPSVDFRGEGCGSKIGDLMSVETEKGQLSTAVFGFNGGTCSSHDRLVVRTQKPSNGKAKLTVWVTSGDEKTFVQTTAHLQKN